MGKVKEYKIINIFSDKGSNEITDKKDIEIRQQIVQDMIKTLQEKTF